MKKMHFQFTQSGEKSSFWDKINSFPFQFDHYSFYGVLIHDTLLTMLHWHISQVMGVVASKYVFQFLKNKSSTFTERTDQVN